MQSIAEATEFVNAQCAFHGKKAQEYAKSSPRRSQQHAQICSEFDELNKFIRFLQDESDRLKATPEGDSKQNSFTPRQLELRLEDIDGLPEDLIRELSITDGDKMDFTIQAIMNDRGGVMSLDQLLIAIYRRTGEVHKRTNLNSRIYRMTTKGALFNVQGRKGVYSTRELSTDELAILDRGSSQGGGSE